MTSDVFLVFLTDQPTLFCRHLTTQAYLVKSDAVCLTSLPKNLTSHVNAPLSIIIIRTDVIGSTFEKMKSSLLYAEGLRNQSFH